MRAATVLLVEDEPEIVGLLTDFLAVEGFGVVASSWTAAGSCAPTGARCTRPTLRTAARG